MLPSVDTRSPCGVAGFVDSKFRELFPEAIPAWLPRLFADVEALFAGRHPDYQPIDLRYHDLEHTLQATVCLTQILAGRARATGGSPPLTARQFELAIASVLLHDAGYLKQRSDTEGTGAKYTFCHVLRSCAFAASYLPTLGASEAEVTTAVTAIACTGPARESRAMPFCDEAQRFIGCALATADYLGQMAAADYPDELEILHAEFQESDDFVHTPAAQRVFQSAEDLTARTPAFWREFVRPKLEREFGAVYRYLAEPYPDGRNTYLEAVERNIGIVERRIARTLSRVG